MELFSQRKGIKPIKSFMQVDSMDDDLRNGLWDNVTICYWDKVKDELSFNAYLQLDLNKPIVRLIKFLWHKYFKEPIDTINSEWHITYEKIREYYFKSAWYEVYDFIEFITNNYLNESVNNNFMELCNSVLERELSAYRFVGGKIAQMTSEEEINEIEEALQSTESLKPVSIHLTTSLNLLSDRKSPDYRNSIKESISAVEAICNLMAKNKKVSLGDALKEIEKRVTLHPALKKAFDSLYGYTSDAEGIRHALLDEPSLDFEDAKFMLVSCSAFINYLITKSSKTGIRL